MDTNKYCADCKAVELVPTKGPHTFQAAVELCPKHAAALPEGEIEMTAQEHITAAESLLLKGDEAATTHAMLAVAKLLQEQHVNDFVCDHGYTGICLFCARDMDLMRPRS